MSQQMDAIANDLANVNTPGYKGTLFSTYLYRPEEVPDGADPSVLRDHLIRADAFMEAVGHVDLTQGQLRPTGSPLDVALDGDGMFAVETPGGVRYTRDGQFNRNGRGELVTHQGYRVLGDTEPLTIPAGEIRVAEDGTLNVDGAPAGRFLVVDIQEPALLEKEAGQLFRYGGAEPAPLDAPRIRGGYLESANIEMVSSMVEMIAVQRAHGAYMDLLRANDELDQKSVSTLGSIHA